MTALSPTPGAMSGVTILASSENSQTLPVGLTNFVSQYGVDWGAMSAAGVLMVIPTLIFVWFAQGLLVKGLVTGAVRGLLGRISVRRGQNQPRPLQLGRDRNDHENRQPRHRRHVAPTQ